MKAFLKLALLFTFLSATLFYNIRFSYLLAFHSLNNESFTELYCVNKDKPQLECNGKCSLAKAGKTANSDKNPGRLENFQKDIPQFFYETLAEDSFISKYFRLYSETEYHNLYRFQFSKAFLHPPAAIS